MAYKMLCYKKIFQCVIWVYNSLQRKRWELLNGIKSLFPLLLLGVSKYFLAARTARLGLGGKPAIAGTITMRSGWAGGKGTGKRLWSRRRLRAAKPRQGRLLQEERGCEAGGWVGRKMEKFFKAGAGSAPGGKTRNAGLPTGEEIASASSEHGGNP